MRNKAYVALSSAGKKVSRVVTMTRFLVFTTLFVLLLAVGLGILWDFHWKPNLSLMPNLIATALGLFLSIPVAILIVNWLIRRHEREQSRIVRVVALRRLRGLLIWSVSRVLDVVPVTKHEVNRQLYQSNIDDFTKLSQALRNLLRSYEERGKCLLRDSRASTDESITAWLVTTLPEVRFCEMELGSLIETLARSNASSTLVATLDTLNNDLILLRRLMWTSVGMKEFPEDLRDTLATAILGVLCYSCLVSDAGLSESS